MKPHKHLRNGKTTKKNKHYRCKDSDSNNQAQSLRHLNKSQNSSRKSAPLRDHSTSQNRKIGSPNQPGARRNCHSKPPISKKTNYSALSSYNHHKNQKDVKDVTKAGENNSLRYSVDIENRPREVTFCDDKQ